MKRKNFVSNDEASVALFGNKWLDALTRTHIAIPVTLFFLYAIGLIYWTKQVTELSNGIIILLFFSGWLLFTFTEYMVHRYFYHIPATTESRRKLQWAIHGMHHDYPKDKQRLAMPPILSIVIGTLLLGIFRLSLGHYGFSTLAGFMVGYASYLIVHYIIHIYRPPKNFLKALWTNHAIHHYGDENTMFGVSSPLWDYVFRTLPERKNKKGVKVTAKT